MVVLAADVFHVNRIPFFLTRSYRIGFYSVQPMTDNKKPRLLDALEQAVKIYCNNGFRVRTVFADGAFECLANEIPGVRVDTCGHSAHVGFIERAVRTTKERMRSVRAGLPFRRLPREVIKQMARFVVMWLNAFPCKNGISNTFSPRTIITGTTMSYRLHARLPFGAYAEIHDNPDPSNLTNVARTSPALCCGPTGDHRGTYIFYNLATGKLNNRHQWTL